MLDKDLLLSVSKPARYTGGELGSVKKDLDRVDVKVCLCFPDTYEIGMSHLGLRILYDILNKRDDCAAERVFSPWVDMEEKLRANGIPLFSLESGLPLKDFDILGFSLQFELNYTNVLNILSLAGIPLRTEERLGQAQIPLVIAGGPACLNPEPMASFIDAFVVGEAEEAIGEVVDIVRRHKREGGRDKEKLLESLSLIPGVYVPHVYREGVSPKVAKRFVKDLDKALDIEHWIVPYIEIVHDRIGIEIMRGCPNNCRFCQARSSFYPLRLLSEKKVLDLARRLYKKTGYEELSLLSLSSSDHPHLEAIVRSLAEEFKDKGVSISLPSLRPKSFLGGISKVFSGMRKTTLTFAPEAGSERLRALMRKELDIDELFRVAREAYRAGYRGLKLYFMIGLPTETKEDLEAIADLSLRLSRLKKETGGPPAHLNISISNFIPKPHTAFQWEGMASSDELRRKQEYLRGLFRKYRGTMRVTFHSVEASVLEGILSRGDRRLGPVIQEAFALGAKFDAWDRLFNFSLWKEAFAKNGLDPGQYLCPKDRLAPLPWDFIDMGFSRETLIREASLALGESL